MASFLRSEMHAQEGIESYVKEYSMSYQQASPSTEPMPKMSLAGNDHPLPLQSIPITHSKQRNSLISRLRTVSSVSRPYSQSLSISSLAGTDTSSQYSYDWHHDSPESAAKSILARGGRMLKRHGSKFNLASYLLEEPHHSDMEVSETCQRPQQSQKKSKTTGSKLSRIAAKHPLIGII